MWFLILLLVVAGAFVAYKFRVPILAKLTGQPEHRIQRHLEQRKKR